MGLLDYAFRQIGYERLKDGTHWYYNNASADYINLSDKLKVAKENPILTPIFNKTAQYFSSADFTHVKGDDETPIEHSPYIKLINNPNVYQSKQDLLEQFIWFKLAYGWVYQLPIKAIGIEVPRELYNLDSSLIKFQDEFKTPILFKESDRKELFRSEIIYDKDNQNLKLKLNQITPYYDLANGLNSTKDANMVTAPSRLDSLKHPLSTIQKAYEAKNVVIGTNGRELFSSGGTSANSMPLGDVEQKRIQNKLNNETGLGRGRTRAIATKAEVNWQSLHIVLKDLGLDDSVASDVLLIISAFSYPPELFGSKAGTWENQNMALLGWLQGVVQNHVDDYASSLTTMFKLPEGEKIIGSLAHLPIMQDIENTRIDNVLKKTVAIRNLVQSGLTQEQSEQFLIDQGLSEM